MPWEKDLEDTRETMKISMQSFCLAIGICFVIVCFLKKNQIGWIYQAENDDQIKSVILSKKRKLSLASAGARSTDVSIHWSFSVLPWILGYVFILQRDQEAIQFRMTLLPW